MKVEGKIQKTVRRLRDERRKSWFWHREMSAVAEEARVAFESAKTKQDVLEVVKTFFGYEESQAPAEEAETSDQDSN